MLHREVQVAAMLDPIRFLRRRERLKHDAETEAALLRRRHGAGAYAFALEKLARDDLTSRYRKVLEKAAARLRD
jgi:hypothetical protein